jgi:hypothetical protein
MKKSNILWLFSVVVILFNFILYLTRWGGENFLTITSDTLPVVCSFFSLFFLWKAFQSFRSFDFARITWLLILIAIALFSLAEIVYGYLEVVRKLDMNIHFPSTADLIWAVGYLPLLAGLIMMFVGYSKSGFSVGSFKSTSIRIVLFILLFVVVAIYLLIPILQDNTVEPLTRFFYFFYPIADVFTVIPATEMVFLMYLLGSGSISIPWRLLAFGFLSFTIADLLYSYLSWNEIYGVGNMTDILWNLGYLLIGMAGFYQKELLDKFRREA